MDISLNHLVERIDDHLYDRASRDYRVDAGLARGLPPVPWPEELTRLDVFRHVEDLVHSPRTDASKRGRLTLLLRALGRVVVDARLADVDARAEQRLAEPVIPFAGRPLSAREAIAELPHVAQADARAALAGSLAGALVDPLAGQRHELTLAALAELGQTFATIQELTRGRPPGPRLDQARAFLASTADAYQDVLTFALRRLDAGLGRRSAELHDVERAVLAPWMFEWLRREDLEHAVLRCVADLGFDPSAEGRITMDAEGRAGKVTGARVYELRVPSEIRLLLTASMGFDAYAQWLGAWGVALHRAHVTRALPVVERRLGDPSAYRAVGALFSSFLLEEGWLRRYLRLTPAQAREAARLFALRQLFELRMTAARALAGEALARLGPGPALDEAAVGFLTSAAAVPVAPARATHGLTPLGDDVSALDAWALEAVLHHTLEERFNEDYFRNPATGRWLKEHAAPGQRETADAIAAALGAPTLDLALAATRRVAALGA